MKRVTILSFVAFLVLAFIGSVAALDLPVTMPSSINVSKWTGDLFQRIGERGFGDSANSYSWAVQWFKGELYVGTNRHHLYSMLGALASLVGDRLPVEISFPEELVPEYPPGAGDPPGAAWWGTDLFANSMKGEIWRYRQGKWQRVHQAGEFAFPGSPPYLPAGQYPVAYGYRAMAEFKGHIYACGIGTWMPPMPINTVIRSATGDPGTWEDVSQNIGQGLTTNIRGIAVWNNKLYISAATAGANGMAGKAVIYESEDPKTEGWRLVNVPGFGTDNSEIYYLAVFNDHLYASTVNLVDGFELWKTDGTVDHNDPNRRYLWKPVIINGFGDSWNQYGMTMAVHGKYLYIGTAVGIGMVMKDNEVVGSRAIEVIRVDKKDHAQLIVGAPVASDPRPGGPNPRVPLSGMGAGFGNPFNVYAWNMNTFKGCLYLGTFDMGLFVLGILQENPQLLELILANYAPSDLAFPTIINSALINRNFSDWAFDMFVRMYGGGDVWKSCDGIRWKPVTLNGFDNPLNYGIRELIPYNNRALAVGTANPFTGKPTGGCEVWVEGNIPSPESRHGHGR